MAEKKVKKRGLGRGLSALMADVEADTFSKPSVGRSADVALPIEKN
jgi:ParB family chromosome partitioning protein